MDQNHLVTMGWWVGGIECVFILVMIKLIFDEKNRLKQSGGGNWCVLPKCNESVNGFYRFESCPDYANSRNAQCFIVSMGGIEII